MRTDATTEASGDMSDRGSVSEWISAIRLGDRHAIERVWDAYFPRLVRYARVVLGRIERPVADEEDAALSALATFWERVQVGEFPNIQNRESLWKLLSLITARKIRRYDEREQAAKRGGSVSSIQIVEGLDEIGRISTSSLDLEAQELLETLGNDELRSIAVLKLMEHTNSEIADQLKMALRTVERKLRLIRTVWLEAIQE